MLGKHNLNHIENDKFHAREELKYCQTVLQLKYILVLVVGNLSFHRV